MAYIGRNPTTSSNQIVRRYVANTDFIAGTTTSLTLPEDPGSANVVCVYIDGVYQEHSEFTVQGTSLTFTTAIPTDASAVEVTLVKAISIGTPSDGTVTTAKLADSAVTSAKTASVIGGFGNVQVYTANTTWTKPSGLKRVKVTVIGGGGSGGGAAATGAGQASAGGGGGGGGCSIKIVEAASLGTTENVTVGTGGTAASAGGTGVTGKTSSFGSHCSATGGSGGTAGGAGNGDQPSSADGGAGGIGSSGNMNFKGGAGHLGMLFGSISQGVGGFGGSSFMAGCTKNSFTTTNTTGEAGSAYGGGSSGGATGSSQSAVGSTAGADGIVIVEEFF